MATQQLMVPIDYTINVNVTKQDPGLATPNTSNIALFTTDSTTIEGSYGAFVDVDSALQTVSADTLTSKMIAALFGTSQTFRNNNGQLFIVPIPANTTLTTSYTTQYEKPITAYEVKSSNTTGYVKVAGNAEDFVPASTQVYSNSEMTEETVTATGSDYKYTGKTVEGSELITAYTSVEGANNSYVPVGMQMYSDAQLNTKSEIAKSNQYLYTGATTSINKVVPTVASASDYIALVTKMKNEIPYFGVLIDNFDLDADLTDFYTFVDTQQFCYIQGVTDYTEVDLSEYKRTEGLYTGGDLQNTKQAIAAFASVGTSANWDGTNTALTMNLKSLSPVIAPGKVDTSVIEVLKEKGISAYALTSGESEVYSHKNKGGYWDDKIGGIALRLQIQYNLYNVAKGVTSKIPQNENGVTMLRTAAGQAWQKFLDNGFLTKGVEWMGTNTFGDKETFLRSIVENGYYQYNKPLSTQTPAERATRSVTIQGAGQSAGAIHFVTYNAILA